MGRLMYFLIYKHVDGGWSVVKERDVDGVVDAINSPFTVEVWIKPRRSYLIGEEIDKLFEEYVKKCEEVEELSIGMSKECEELWKRISELEQERQTLYKLENFTRDEVMKEISKCKNDECIRETLQKYGFTRAK